MFCSHVRAQTWAITGARDLTPRCPVGRQGWSVSWAASTARTSAFWCHLSVWKSQHRVIQALRAPLCCGYSLMASWELLQSAYPPPATVQEPRPLPNVCRRCRSLQALRPPLNCSCIFHAGVCVCVPWNELCFLHTLLVVYRYWSALTSARWGVPCCVYTVYSVRYCVSWLER